MADRQPIVLVSGAFAELPPGDGIIGASVTLISNPSGLYTLGGELGYDGTAITALASGNAALSDVAGAIASGNAALVDSAEALASGNAALVDVSTAQASGNAALVDLGGKYDKTGGPITGTVTIRDQSIGEVADQGVRNGTITLDFGSANNFEFVLDGNGTLGAPTNASGGQCGAITIRQDSTGSRTMAYNAVFNFAGGTAPTLTTTASGVDVISFYVSSSTEIQSVAVLNLS